MKYRICYLLVSCFLLLMLSLSSCTTVPQHKAQNSNLDEKPVLPVEKQQTVKAPTMAPSLPVQYQRSAYVVDKNATGDVTIAEESKLKVGARIISTRGPQPLWDIVKRLASLKGMNVSWASDVDKNVLVDVNINADDDFYNALDNMLRQVDYYHEMQGSTIIIKYKETRQFHIAMPFIKQTYKTNTGGDVLGGSGGEKGNTNVAGEISLSTEGVKINQTKDGKPGDIEFDTWHSIENNLNAILNIWTTDAVGSTDNSKSDQTDANSSNNRYTKEGDVQKANTSTNQGATATFRRSSGGNTYFIDKPIGLITVTAPRPLMEKLEVYFKTLKEELYKQISIEAKVIEVQLNDSSSVGLNWNLILKNLSVAGGQYSGSKTYAKSNLFDSSAIPSAATIISDGLTRNYSSAISLAAFTFDSFLHAVGEQGKTTILSNPKLSVLNGQPALMTVGRNVTYIDKITADVGSGDNAVITYSAETARALSGVGLALTANILDNNQIILNLVPVTSELVEPIEYRAVGLGEVGLPIINVREMSTTVRVNNGEMLVVGGLISNSSGSGGTFVPGTNKIPFFKYLFGFEEKTSSKSELIILLRPRII